MKINYLKKMVQNDLEDKLNSSDADIIENKQ